jgi:hypothetical protein
VSVASWRLADWENPAVHKEAVSRGLLLLLFFLLLQLPAETLMLLWTWLAGRWLPPFHLARTCGLLMGSASQMWEGEGHQQQQF